MASVIQNEINRIVAERDTQTSLINQIATALEGKAAGGGGASVDTCSVRIYNSDGTIRIPYTIYYLTVENGEIKEKMGGSQAEGFDITLENVLCNSHITFAQYGAYYPWGDGTNARVDTMGDGQCYVIYVTAPAGGMATAKLYDDD